MAKQRQSAKAATKSARPGKTSSPKRGTAARVLPAKKKKASPAKAAPARPAPSRPASSRPAAATRPPARRAIARKPSPAASIPRGAASRGTAPKRPGPPAAAVPQVAAPASRKPGFYEAVAVYERGVQALQRHDYDGAAGHFRTILDKYPGEQELLERARLYLRVCERETERLPPAPKTAAERVYAATVALNSGDHAGALDHLQRALAEDPDSDHAHYTMAVALGMRGRPDEALTHLRRAVALNPDNRAIAREDPDLESIRNHHQFGQALNTPPAPGRRRPSRRP